MGVGDGTGYGASVGLSSQPKQLAASLAVGGRCVCVCVWCCSHLLSLAGCVWRSHTCFCIPVCGFACMPLYLPSSNLTPSSHPLSLSPPLPLFRTHTRTQQQHTVMVYKWTNRQRRWKTEAGWSKSDWSGCKRGWNVRLRVRAVFMCVWRTDWGERLRRWKMRLNLERDFCTSHVRAFLLMGGCALACRWVNCAARGSPAVPH